MATNKPMLPLKPQHQPEAEDFRTQQLTDQIASIQDSLKHAESRDIPTLAERIFVGVFLPLFAGDDPLPYKVDLAMWTNVAGTPFRPVNIIDHTGKFLFEVPPLYDRGAIDPVPGDRSQAPIAHMVQSAGQLSLMSPRQGSAYLSAELTKRALVMNVPTNVLTHLERWNEIFVRYGRAPLIALDPKETVAGKPAEAAKPEDDYDIELL